MLQSVLTSRRLFFLSRAPKNTTISPTPESPPPSINGAILVLSSVIKNVVSSIAKAELRTLFHIEKEAEAIHAILANLGYPQPPTPLQTDNKCAAGISNDSVKKKKQSC